MGVDSNSGKTSDFQSEIDGSIPISTLHFSRCQLKEVSKFIKKNHYSHTYPGGVDYSFKAVSNNEIVGACIFGYMAGNPNAIHYNGYNPKDFRELMRLVLLDQVGKNAESKFISWCLRYLKKNTNIKCIISFADPKFGHTGIVYRASNWQYLGKQKPDRPRMIIDGKEIHPRMAYNKFGTSSYKKIRLMGHTVELLYREPKHKYIFILKPCQ